MSAGPSALVGAVGGIGMMLLLSGWRGVIVVDLSGFTDGRYAAQVDGLILRIALAMGTGLGAMWFSRWIVLTVVAAAMGWLAPGLPAARARHARELALVEAVATWTEQLRDTLSAANGLEHALGATAALAPPPIAGAVGRLAARHDFEPLADALRQFAHDVDHPAADFVVAALIIAAEQQARDLSSLLGQLADSARDDARMRTRVWVARARSRSAVRIIVVVVVAFVCGLMLLNREYLRPYDSAGGQFVLGVIAVGFIGAFVMMARMGRVGMPERFVARREVLRHEAGG
jgi:Flp pilus assembly protein TadB